jgi:hypothetical protein
MDAEDTIGIVEDSDLDSLIDATPNVNVGASRKRRVWETSGSSENLVGAKVKRVAMACQKMSRASQSSSGPGIKLPSNATLKSAGSGQTILVKPQGPNAITFLKDPIGLAKGIRDSPFGAISDLIVRTNPRRQLIALESPSLGGQEMFKFLAVSTIGKWSVRCYQPGSDVRVCGVLGPIDPSASIDEIKEIATAGEFVVVNIVRLDRFRDGKREPSATLKVVFEGQTLPSRVKIGYVSYPVRPFVAPPMRCYRCQKLWHLAEGCNLPRRCLLCAGPHEHSVCTSTERCCANCKGPHRANSLECPFIAKATAVEKLRANGRTYAQAVKEIESNAQGAISNQEMVGTRATHFPSVASTHSSFTSPVITIADVHQSQGSCLSSRSTQMQQLTRNQRASSSNLSAAAETDQIDGGSYSSLRKIMKEELASTEKHLEETIRASLTGFTIRLGKFMNEVFKLNLQNEGTKERTLLLISLLRNAFGQEASEALQEEWMSGNKISSQQGQSMGEESPEVNTSHTPQSKKAAGAECTRGRIPMVRKTSLQKNQALPKQSGRSKGRDKNRTAGSGELSQ